MAAKTWTGEWWSSRRRRQRVARLHLRRRSSISSTSAPATARRGTGRSAVPGGGDNLFLCSIVALNPDTGEYIWHYQTTPGETWDFNSNMDIVLADLPIDGRPRKAILHAPKNGFFYVHRSHERQADLGRAVHRDDVGERHRPGDRPARSRSKARATSAAWPRSRRRRSAATTGRRCRSTRRPGSPTTRRCTSPRRSRTRASITATWRSTPWLGGYGVNGQFVTGSSRKDGGIASLQAWDPVRQRLAWEVPIDGLFNPGHADDGRQPRLPGPRGRHVPGVRGRHRQGTVAARPWPRHLGAADHLRRERQAVRRDPRRVGRRDGRAWRAALGRARLGVRRADARRSSRSRSTERPRCRSSRRPRSRPRSRPISRWIPCWRGRAPRCTGAAAPATGLAPWPPAWRPTSAPRPR